MHMHNANALCKFNAFNLMQIHPCVNQCRLVVAVYFTFTNIVTKFTIIHWFPLPALNYKSH